MRFYLKYFLGGFALIALALPAWARTEQMSLILEQPTMIGTAQVPVGEYQVKADDAKTDLMIMKDGKVVADVQGQWVKLPAKAQDSEVSYSGNHLTQVQFSGSIEAFHIG